MIKRMKYAWLVCRSWYELARYDLITMVRGSSRLDRRLCPQPVDANACSDELVHTTCDALLLATCFYLKSVLCLQRSICLVRLLRTNGVAARLVIGYRAAPFFSHAWVEVAGQIVNDSPGYRERLQVLYTA